MASSCTYRVIIPPKKEEGSCAYSLWEMLVPPFERIDLTTVHSCRCNNPILPKPHDQFILRFMIRLTTCFKVGKAQRWATFPKGGIGLSGKPILERPPRQSDFPLSEAQYFRTAPTLGLYQNVSGFFRFYQLWNHDPFVLPTPWFMFKPQDHHGSNSFVGSCTVTRLPTLKNWRWVSFLLFVETGKDFLCR
jgi:hypothetical protein